MIGLHEGGTLHRFADGEAVMAHFSLTHLDAETLSGIEAASDAGFPLHAAVDPYYEEIRGIRVLLLDNDQASLRAEYRMRQQDI